MNTRRRSRRGALVAMPLALLLALLLSGQTQAMIYVHQTGSVGHWSWLDDQNSPGVTCKYGSQVVGSNGYKITKFVVQPPTVYAADRNPDKVDTRTISWQVQVQRKLIPNGTWKIVGSSAVHKASATDQSPAPLTMLSLRHTPTDLAHSYDVRIQVLIKWIKPSGAVEGTILFRPSYYAVMGPAFGAGFVSGNPYCQEVQTTG